MRAIGMCETLEVARREGMCNGKAEQHGPDDLQCCGIDRIHGSSLN